MLRAELQYGRVEDILASGLHQYLEHFLDRINDLGNRISQDFLVPLSAERSMKQIITHVTHYRYTAPVTYSIQTLRLTPRDDEHQRVLRWHRARAGRWTPTAISPIP